MTDFRTYPRDLIGYGRNPPDVRWPEKAHVAVSFVLNIEEGAELSEAGREFIESGDEVWAVHEDDIAPHFG